MSGHVELQGEIIFASKGLFKVLIDTNKDNINTQTTVQCALSGKLRQNRINLVVGDYVKIKVSPYDLSKGFIVYRL